MAMKMEDEVNHVAEVLDIKIEVSNAGAEEEAKETMEITEKIKRVIEESFGKDSGGATGASKDAAEEDLDNFAQESSAESGDGVSNIEIAETNAAPLVDNVIKLDYLNMSNDDYDDIAESESDHDSLELEELADAAITRSEEDQNETDEKLKLFAKEMRKLKTLPVPGSRKSNFRRDIKNAFEKLLPPQVLAKLTPNRCGLCHEDFTSERYAWKHYTGYNHKRTVRYFINGTYKDHPSFYNMVLDSIHFHNPDPVTEKQIFDFIKKEHPVGDNDARTMNLIRQRGLSRLLQIEYVVNQDGKFTATHALLNRKKRSKQLLDRTESMKYPEPVKLQSPIKEKNKKNIKMDKNTKLSQADYEQFGDQIFDFSKKDLPKSVIDTLTPENCGLCHLDIYCKPWSHYTGAGHRTTVELYQSGSYLGHPPYPTMVEKYIKEMQPATLKETDIIKFLKKNFNIGEDMEKVQARVEKCVEMLKKKQDLSHPKMKLPSDNLVWFKKDTSEDNPNKMHLNDKRDQMRHKEDRHKDDGRIKDLEKRHIESSNNKEHRSTMRKKELPLKRKSSPGYPERDRDESHGRSRKSDRNYSHHISGRSRDSSGRSDDKYRTDPRWNERSSRGENKKHESSVQKLKSPDRRRRSAEKLARPPGKKRSYEGSSRQKSSESHKRSPNDRHGRSHRRKERSPDIIKTSSRSSNPMSLDYKRSRRSSGSHQREYTIKKETSNALKSPNKPSPRTSTGSSYSKDARPSKDSSSTSPNILVGHSYDTSRSYRQDNDAPSNSKSRPKIRDPLSNLTNPSPPPGSLPPDFMMATPNPALPTPVTQSQMPFPASFLTQHPQFPHVFILNTMGSQMGGQMMMPVPMGQQHPPPNQPPTL